MGMGWWGTHFGRHQTWAKPGRAFFRYLARVQALLQRGEAPADFVSVGIAQDSGDVIAPGVFLNATRVEKGRIVLESGRTYPFIHVPHSGALLPEMVRRIESLLAQGATVVAAKPDRSPSLAGYPDCDAQVKSLASALWGEDGKSMSNIGPGKLYTRGDVTAALRDLGITPTSQVITPNAGDVRIAHRRDGAAEIFFVANVNEIPANFTVSFRVRDSQPELWDAETGTMMFAPLWRTRGDRTEVDLALGAAKSIFVIFRAPVPVDGDHLVAVDAPAGWAVASDAAGRPVIRAATALAGTALLASGRCRPFAFNPISPTPVAGPWQVELTPVAGAPAQTRLDSLISLSEHPADAIKYFSGTATYRTTVQMEAATLEKGRRVMLDLGEVRDLAQITINGRDLGVLWHPPYRLDITAVLRPGANTLVLAVTNTWHNRLVGDEQLPADVDWGTDRGPARGRALKAYPEWFIKNQPRPSAGRQGFVTWFYHRPDTPLLPAGLLGPVRLVPIEELPLH
jgi:hypothetical protein